MTNTTLTAHAKHHGTSDMANRILAARVAAGWTEAEIVANQKPVEPWATVRDSEDPRREDRNYANIVRTGCVMGQDLV